MTSGQNASRNILELMIVIREMRRTRAMLRLMAGLMRVALRPEQCLMRVLAPAAGTRDVIIAHSADADGSLPAQH